MEPKKYTQVGTASILIMVPLFLFFSGMAISSGLTNRPDFMIMGFVSILMLLCCLTFYKITIAVSQTQVSFKMGIGLFGKTYQMSDIRQCRPVSNSFIAGIGIRMLPNGWLYNVSGIKAIELQFKNKYSVVRIGTNKPEEISEYIQSIVTGRYATYANSEQPGRRWINPWWGLIIAFVILAVFLPGWIGIKTECRVDALKIKGMYSQTIPYAQVEKLDTISSLPAVSLRTNGYSFNETMIGNFRMEDGSDARLYIRKNSGPYIRVRQSGNKLVYISLKDRATTIGLYNQLKSKIN
jgi:hypothetical protein